MFNFALCLANSDQETIKTIRFDSYRPNKVLTKFHQKLILLFIWRNQVNFQVYGQDSKKKLGSDRQQKKLILFDSQDRYFLRIIFCLANTELKLAFITYYNNDKCFLVLVIYIGLLCFIFYFWFSNSREQQIKKKSVGRNFKKLFFCFCLKQGRQLLQTNKLTWFRLSNTFQKPNQRQHNLSQIVLNIMTFLRTALHFLIFKTNFDQRTIRFDPCYLFLKNSIKKNFFLFQIFMK